MNEDDVSNPRLPNKLTATRLGIFEQQENVGPTQRLVFNVFQIIV